MKPEDRSKLHTLIGDLEKLKSRNPEEKKFQDWKKDAEKKIEELFGKGSTELSMFKRCRFFDFRRSGKPPEAPLAENERREFIQCLDNAKRQLQRFL
jgi:hypothetical protein